VKRPNYLERKAILFSPQTSGKEAVRWGDQYLESRSYHDAVAFYRRAEHGEGLRRIRELAVESGDCLLFREAAEGSTSPAEDPDALLRLAGRAEKLGRWNDARKAYEQLGDDTGVRRAKEALIAVTGAAVPETPTEGQEGASPDLPDKLVSGQPTP